MSDQQTNTYRGITLLQDPRGYWFTRDPLDIIDAGSSLDRAEVEASIDRLLAVPAVAERRDWTQGMRDRLKWRTMVEAMQHGRVGDVALHFGGWKHEYVELVDLTENRRAALIAGRNFVTSVELWDNGHVAEGGLSIIGTRDPEQWREKALADFRLAQSIARVEAENR